MDEYKTLVNPPAPWFWIFEGFFMGSLYPVSNSYDEWLNAVLDSKKIIKVKRHAVIFEDFPNTEIWIRNYPYSYGKIRSRNQITFENRLPKAKTRIRLKKAVDEFNRAKGSQKDKDLPAWPTSHKIEGIKLKEFLQDESITSAYIEVVPSNEMTIHFVDALIKNLGLTDQCSTSSDGDRTFVYIKRK